MAKHVSVLAIYEQEPEYLVPAAIIQLVEDEGSSVVESPFYLEMILRAELGESDTPYIVEQFALTPDEVVSPYATSKLVGQVYDQTNSFPEYINVQVDEDYLNELDERYFGEAI